LPSGTVVLTFDDAYRDFADHAMPELDRRGWRATVFVPVLPVDADRPWDCGDGHRRALLSWQTIAELAARGIEMGAHSMSHADLTRLPVEEAEREIVLSRDRVQMAIGGSVTGFAAPFGRITRTLRAGLPAHFVWSVSARMARAGLHSDLFDLPRIEMWYFRRLSRWRRYVARGWTPYFGLRATLRAVKEIV
jgi:peptidoglycan/xylan/chitin deacetylase (PgdA/CDA1 family)